MVFGSKKKKPAKEKAPAKKTTTKNEKAAVAEEEGVMGEPSIDPAPASAAPNTAQQQTPGAPPVKVEMLSGPPPEEIYVDGISSLSFRSNVVKMDCYRVAGQDPQENTEKRMATHRLVMPASALQELIQLLQNASERQRERAAAEAETEEAN